jgi:Zn-dependent metalloprotease
MLTSGGIMSHRTISILSMILITLSIFATSISASNQSKSRQAFERLSAEYPAVESYTVDGRITQLYGRSFGGGVDAVSAADKFRNENSAIFGAKSTDLTAGSDLADGRKTQQLIYDRKTGTYKFTLVYYTQQRDGIPVYGSELKVLVLNEPGYPVVLARSTLHDLGDYIPADKSIARYDIAQNVVRVSHPELKSFAEPKTVIWAGDDDVSASPVLALKFTASGKDYQKWAFVADAGTGEILHEENLIIFEDIVGNVSGYATEGFASGDCNEEVLTPLPYARIAKGSVETFADSNGDFVFPYAGTDLIILSSQLEGAFFHVYDVTGEGSLVSASVTPPGPANFVHNLANDEFTRAEVNGYYQANVVRDMILSFNPSFPTIDEQAGFPVSVNRTDGYCPGNAWYDGSSINFCQGLSGYPNTAFSTVIHHEYGHHAVAESGNGQDQYGEGYGDVMGVLITDTSGLAYGFYGSGYCDYPLRNADNTFQYPCYGEAHHCGNLISGCVWSTRNELLASYPDTYRQILGSLAVNSMFLHSGDKITPQITIAWLTLDDDDANILNGTPHYPEICAGFGAHNMDCPALAPIWFEYPDGLPTIVAPDQDTDFRVIVRSGTVAPVDGTGMLYYSIDGSPYESEPMSVLGTNEYEATLPGALCQSVIDWYVGASNEGGGQTYDPIDAPAIVYSDTVPPVASVYLFDNFNFDNNWVTGGTATSGQWERGVPAGDGSHGDPTTDYDGSGSCYLTGNEPGESDVDNGSVTLMSPALQLEGFDASISYAYWYSNDVGNAPHADYMSVDVSSDDGVTWENARIIGPVVNSSGGWYTDQLIVSDFVTPTNFVRVRFVASDMGDDSNIEAAIDDVTVTTLECINYLCGDPDASGDVDIDDVVYVISYIFSGGAAPNPLLSGDADCSGAVDIDDVVYLISYIFSGGPVPCAACSS